MNLKRTRILDSLQTLGAALVGRITDELAPPKIGREHLPLSASESLGAGSPGFPPLCSSTASAQPSTAIIDLLVTAANPSEQNAGLVSIVITADAEAKHLGEAIDSIKAQSYQSWELIIIDCDPGKEAEWRSALSKDEDPRIRILAGKELNLTEAEARGAHSARGRFVLTLKAQDKLHRLALEKLHAMLVRHTEIGWAYAHVLNFGDRSDLQYCPDYYPGKAGAEAQVPYCALYRRSLVAPAGLNHTAGFGRLVPEPLFLRRT